MDPLTLRCVYAGAYIHGSFKTSARGGHEHHLEAQVDDGKHRLALRLYLSVDQLFATSEMLPVW